MTAVVMPDSEELYLIALLDDPSGIDLAEFSWIDEEEDDGCFRVWDFQWSWYSCDDVLQIDQCGRAIGKSNGIQMRAFAFPFNYPGQEMLVTAPELNHLRPLVDAIEQRFLSTRLGNEMLPVTKGRGIARQPHWQARFANGARIISRLPNKDGKGVKGSVCNASPNLCYGETMILTIEGHRPIEALEVGDLVLTHEGRYMPVERIHRYEAEGYEVAGAGHRGIVVSANHRFYARRNRNPQRARNLDPATWLIVDDPELPRWYWASPARFPSLRLPDLPPGVDEALWPTFAYVIGRYLADGLLGGSSGGTHSYVQWVDEEVDIQVIEGLLRLLGCEPKRRPQQSSASAIAVYDVGLVRWLDGHFGHLAAGKRLPAWVLGAPGNIRQNLLEGYLAGDGHFNAEKGRWETGSASKDLAIGIKLLGQTQGMTGAFTWVDPKQSRVMGRDLLVQPQRSFRVQLNADGRGIFEDGFVWQKLRSAKKLDGPVPVFDLVVAEDGSYVADGIVHRGGL